MEQKHYYYVEKDDNGNQVVHIFNEEKVKYIVQPFKPDGKQTPFASDVEAKEQAIEFIKSSNMQPVLLDKSEFDKLEGRG